MSAATNPVYVFGPFRFDPHERVLLREGAPVALTPKALEILHVLARNGGRIVEKEELLREVWPDTFVEEGNLTVHISALRRALGDGAEGSTFVETVPRRGYRFCMSVQAIAVAPPALVVERVKQTHIVREEVEEETGSVSGLARSLALSVVAVAVIAALVIGWRATRSRAALPALRVAPFASYPGAVHAPAFAPDGERIAFPWTGPVGQQWDIYVKVIGNDPPLRLTSSEDSDGLPTWSPDGRSLAFIRESRRQSAQAIYIIGALGGAERKLVDLPWGRNFDLKWSPDGKTIAFAKRTVADLPYDSHRSMSIFLVNIETQQMRQLTFPKDPERDQRFAFSPDGKTLAFIRHGMSTSALMRVSVQGGEPQRVHFEQGWIGRVAWSADGQSLIFGSDREGGSKLFRVAASGGTVEAVPLADDAIFYHTVAARGNRMAYVRMTQDVDLWQVDVPQTRGTPAAPRSFLATARFESSAEFSPDGRRVAYFSEASGRRELWISAADGTGAHSITDFQTTSGHPPSWSPDGTELAFFSTRGPGNGPGGVFVADIETRKVRRVTDTVHFMPWFSRDGRWLYVTASRSQGTHGTWKVSVQGGPLIKVTEHDGLLVQESHDGRDIYYSRLAGGIWKIPSAGGPEVEVLPGFESDLRGYWRVARNGIYYLKKTSPQSQGIEVLEFATGRTHHLATLTGTYTEFNGGLTVSPNGRRVIFSQTGTAPNEILLVENFR